MRKIQPVKKSLSSSMVFTFCSNKMKKLKRGHYHIVLETIAEAPYEKGDMRVIDQYARMVEEQMREQPAYWLWSHRRWKHARD